MLLGERKAHRLIAATSAVPVAFYRIGGQAIDLSRAWRRHQSRVPKISRRLPPVRFDGVDLIPAAIQPGLFDLLLCE